MARAAVILALSATSAPAWSQGLRPDPVTTSSGTGRTLAFTHTVGAAGDRYLLVALTLTARPISPTAVSYGGQPLASLGASASQGNLCRTELWGTAAPAAGAHQVVITLPEEVTTIAAAAISHAGVDQNAPVGPFVPAEAWGVDVSLSIAGGVGQSIVDAVCVYKTGRLPTIVVGAGQTEWWNVADSPLVFLGSVEPGAGGAVAMTWSVSPGSSSTWAAAAVALQPAQPPAPMMDGAAPGDGPGRSPDAREASASDRPPAPDQGSEPTGPRPEADAGLAANPVHLQVGCACRAAPPPGSAGGGAAGWAALAWLVALASRRRG